IRWPFAGVLYVLSLPNSFYTVGRVILWPGNCLVPTAMAALKGGAYDYLETPYVADRLIDVIKRALDHRALILRSRAMERAILRNDAAAVNFPGSSDATRKLHQNLRNAAGHRHPIHIYGPSGSGKRTAAYVIHTLGPDVGIRMRIDARGATPQDLEGMPWHDDPADLVVRSISAATSQVLETLHRLLQHYPQTRLISLDQNADCFVPDTEPQLIQMPSLQNRRDDLPVIFETALRAAARQHDVDMPDLAPEWMADLYARSWPGNLVELRAFALDCVLGKIENTPSHRTFHEQMDDFEYRLLINALQITNGRAGAAAQYLGLPRNTFYDRLAKYGIRPKTFKTG
ncbi:MAG: helix-turn-helix domain-containing protein, partial [Pseudomonadota bacterium]